MNIRCHNRATAPKGSAVTALVVVLAIVLIGGGIWYFTSDVFRTRANSAMRDMTEWTPENIAKNPVLYLDFVEEKTQAAASSLKASKVAVQMSRGKLQTTREDARNAVDVGAKAKSELIAAYKAADAANTWPVTWRDQSFTKDQLKTQIMTLDGQVTTKQNLLNKAESGIKTLDAQDAKIYEAEAKAKTQLEEIRVNRDMLKVQTLTDELKNKLVDMKSAVAATINTANESQSVKTLDQLTAEAATTVDNSAFEKVLGNSK